jgi:hypothetical protein
MNCKAAIRDLNAAIKLSKPLTLFLKNGEWIEHSLEYRNKCISDFIDVDSFVDKFGMKYWNVRIRVGGKAKTQGWTEQHSPQTFVTEVLSDYEEL